MHSAHRGLGGGRERLEGDGGAADDVEVHEAVCIGCHGVGAAIFEVGALSARLETAEDHLDRTQIAHMEGGAA